jgi:hypothetical protein
MLGGRKLIHALQVEVNVLKANIAELKHDHSMLWHEVVQMRKELDAKLINLQEDVPKPVDRYAKLRDEDGFFSTQAYKRRKSGLGG